MSVVIRLMRAGAKKRPFYRMVAADSRRQRDGRFLEILGHYNPVSQPYELVVHKDKVQAWIQKGAQPSEQAASLLRSLGISLAYPTATAAPAADQAPAKKLAAAPRKRAVARKPSPRKVRARAARKTAKQKVAVKASARSGADGPGTSLALSGAASFQFVRCSPGGVLSATSIRRRVRALPSAWVLLAALLVAGCAPGARRAALPSAEARAGALIEAGNQAFRSGAYQLAARRYAAAAVNRPDDPAAYYGLGMSLAKLGRDEEARAAYAHARELAHQHE